MTIRSIYGRMAFVLPGAFAVATLASPAAGQVTNQQQHQQQVRSAQGQQKSLIRHQYEAQAKSQLEALKAEIDKNAQSLPEIQNKVEAARQEAEKLKPDVETAQQELDKLRGSFRDAAAQEKAAQNKVNEILDRLEGAQPATSPIRKAHAHSDETLSKYRAAVDNAVNSPEYKKGYQDAIESGDRLLAGSFHSDFLKKDAALAGLADAGRKARAEYASLRDQLGQGNSEYQAAADALKKSQAEQADIKKQGAAAVKKLSQAKAAYQAKLAAVKKTEPLLKRQQSNQSQLEARQQRLQAWLDASQKSSWDSPLIPPPLAGK